MTSSSIYYHSGWENNNNNDDDPPPLPLPSLYPSTPHHTHTCSSSALLERKQNIPSIPIIQRPFPSFHHHAPMSSYPLSPLAPSHPHNNNNDNDDDDNRYETSRSDTELKIIAEQKEADDEKKKKKKSGSTSAAALAPPPPSSSDHLTVPPCQFSNIPLTANHLIPTPLQIHRVSSPVEMGLLLTPPSSEGDHRRNSSRTVSPIASPSSAFLPLHTLKSRQAALEKERKERDTPSAVSNSPLFDLFTGGTPKLSSSLLCSSDRLRKYIAGQTETSPGLAMDDIKYLINDPNDAPADSDDTSSDDLTWTSYVTRLEKNKSIFHIRRSNVDAVSSFATDDAHMQATLQPPSWRSVITSSLIFQIQVIICCSLVLLIQTAFNYVVFRISLKEWLAGPDSNTAFNDRMNTEPSRGTMLTIPFSTITILGYVCLQSYVLLREQHPKKLISVNTVSLTIATLITSLVNYNSGPTNAYYIGVLIYFLFVLYHSWVAGSIARPKSVQITPQSSGIDSLRIRNNNNEALRDTNRNRNDSSSTTISIPDPAQSNNNNSQMDGLVSQQSHFSMSGFLSIALLQISMMVIALVLVTKLFPIYAASSRSQQALLSTAVIPLSSVLVFIIARICVYSLTHVHAGNVFILYYGIVASFAFASRVMVAGLGSMSEIMAVSIFHSALNVVARATIKFRDRLGYFLLYRKWPPSTFFHDPRKWRIAGDWIIVDFMYETYAIIQSNVMIAFVRIVVMDQETHIAISDCAISLIAQLSIDFVFNFISIIIEQRIGIAVSLIWQRRRITFVLAMMYLGLISITLSLASSIEVIKQNLKSSH